jgi:hypothetical protein
LKKNDNLEDDAKEKIKSKLFVLSDSTKKEKDQEENKKIKIPKSLIAPAKNKKEGEGFKIKDKNGEIIKKGMNKLDRNDEKHYHLHLYHHL